MVDEKVTVLLWLYHHDLWPEFLKLLLPLEPYIKLHIGLYYQHSSKKIEYDAIKYFEDIHLSVYDNYGADLPCFLKQLQSVDTDLFIKIHSKKSMWGVKSSVNWRAVLLQDLIGSIDILQSNIKQVLENHKIGMISNKNLLLDNRELAHSDKIKELCKIIKVPYKKVAHSSFPAGNMFLGKTKIFQKYFNDITLPIIDEKLKKETGKVNEIQSGTFSHALERMFGYIIRYERLSFEHPKHIPIKILNDKAPNGYFNLIPLYDKSCYIQEDLNMDGEIIENHSKYLIIEWKYLDPIIRQKYNKITTDTIIRDEL